MLDYYFMKNIIDVINNNSDKERIDFYINFLNNICVSDYIDRIYISKTNMEF